MKHAPAIIVVCVLAAVLYGVVHDQVTARVCVEYFTIGHPRIIDSQSPTVLGLVWGVVATWWVGLPLGIGLAIAARAGQGRAPSGVRALLRPIGVLLAVLAALALLAGIVGWQVASRGGVYLLKPMASRVPADRHVAFLAVLWAHSASYLGGTIGGVILWIHVYRSRPRPAGGRKPHAPPL